VITACPKPWLQSTEWVGDGGAWGGSSINTGSDETEVQPPALTVKVYSPEDNPSTVVLVPDPVVTTPPGFLVSVHVPPGNPLRVTDPVGSVHAGWMIVPMDGAEGVGNTVSVYVAVAGSHGSPFGLSVVKVIVTVLPASLIPGLYVKEKGELFILPGLTEPLPFSVTVTCVALPPKVLSLTVIDDVTHVVPSVLLKLSVGLSTQPQSTWKDAPSVIHPDPFLTLIE